jgi:uroporphyrinogen-III synthase
MKRVLYLGLEIPPHLDEQKVMHHPIIKIEPRLHSQPDIQEAFLAFTDYTHLIFTSRTAVSTFFNLMEKFHISVEASKQKIFVALGERTAAKLREQGIENISIAEQETAEGVAKHLEILNLTKTKNLYLFLPQSSLARPVLREWLTENRIRHTICPLYDTVPNLSLPLLNLKDFDEIIFTSSSTVHAFITIYGSFPKDITFTAIGPITQACLQEKQDK